jgi:prepilin-type N-terminal cleavage/methylation domain-containing protein
MDIANAGRDEPQPSGWSQLREEDMEARKMHKKIFKDGGSARGFTLLELLIVLAIGVILTAIAVPQMIAQRRLSRSVMATRQIATQIRYARQLSMSLRNAVTFQYNDSTKQIKIIDHNNNQPGNVSCNLTGTAVMAASGFPMTACATVNQTVSLATGGLPTSELSYGIPTTPSLPTAALGDGISKTSLSGTPASITITFQNDGRVLDANLSPVNTAMYIYNNVAPEGTASAISVIGASGRVKIWRYTTGANAYVE